MIQTIIFGLEAATAGALLSLIIGRVRADRDNARHYRDGRAMGVIDASHQIKVELERGPVVGRIPLAIERCQKLIDRNTERSNG